MTEVKSNMDLQDKNTFRLPARARFYAEFSNLEELRTLCSDSTLNTMPRFVLGGGSNTVFTKDFDGLILHPVNNHVEVIEENEETVRLRVGAGKDWSEFVRQMVRKKWTGLENLSGIPGTVGGAAVQNIGAYGSEVSECIDAVECYEPRTDSVRNMSCKECTYGYRTSFFKTQAGKELIVLSVVFVLSKVYVPKLRYKALADRLRSCTPKMLTPAVVASEVLAIRKKKLPSIQRLGSAGSFFKNPVLPRMQGRRLLETYPDAAAHRLTSGRLKLSAAWLIDVARLKNKRCGDAHVYRKQPLVIVNAGHATGEDVMRVAQMVAEGVKNRFNIILEPEPVIL